MLRKETPGGGTETKGRIEHSRGAGMSRRGFIAATSGVLLGTRSTGWTQSEAGPRLGPSQDAADVAFINGKFVDHRGVAASTVTIHEGRIARVDPPGIPTDALVIDLGGRTVVPGLIDGHVHYTRAGINPGYQARRVERAFSIAQLQEAIARRAVDVPPGEFITCIGGWNHLQLRERRPPARSELDDAAPAHSVYLSGTGGGTGAITNLSGRAFFTERGIEVDEVTGAVGSPNDAVAALQSLQTAEDRLRGTADLNAFSSGLGLTMVINSGNLEDQGLALELWRRDRLAVRMRPTFPAETPEDVEARAAYNFNQGGRAVGDDWFRPLGFGERIGGGNTMSENFLPTARAVARTGWPLQQHSISPEENAFHIAAFESIDGEFPIRDLRWALIHLQAIDEAVLRRLDALGAGASAQTWTYLSTAGGPPFRRIVESGIPAAVGTDSTNVSALDPWLSLFYMTTGRNLAGELTNDGQQVSRVEALGLYTRGAAWFAFDDDRLGAFEEGKLADLAVLDRDYLTVPDDSIRQIESLLTLVGGRVVHASGPFASIAG